jgi:hypothetical protein
MEEIAGAKGGALPAEPAYRSAFAVDGHVVVMPTRPSWLEELKESCEPGGIRFDRDEDVVVVLLHDALPEDYIPLLLEQMAWALQTCRSGEQLARDEAGEPFQLQLVAFMVGGRDAVLDATIEAVPAGYASSDVRAASLAGAHCGADELGEVIVRLASSPPTPRRQRLAPALKAVRRICAMVSTMQWLPTEYFCWRTTTTRRSTAARQRWRLARRKCLPTSLRRLGGKQRSQDLARLPN